MHPASAVKIPYDSSKPRILFIRPVCRITSSNTGTLPPTSPVFPPYGTTANFRELQYLKHSAVSSVVAGLNANLDLPTNFFVQSVL